LTSTIEPEFSQFGTADGGTEYRDLEDILQNGVPDEEMAEHPACIFTVVAPGDPYYLGDDFTRLVEISPQITVETSINGVEAFGENELFQAVINMEKALLHNNQFALGGTVLEEMQDNLDRLLKCRSEVGARMERLLITDERIHSEQIYLRELRSKVEDIDMAEAITEFMMQENAYQAALSTGARIIYPSLIDFLR
jgi:flagellar hook-associated protein 3 FlgL